MARTLYVIIASADHRFRGLRRGSSPDPRVVAAPPGIQTHLDLPAGKPRGLFR